mmetsp:Transcript_33610/g.45432  ORF Transcript_33610/g.45432 Transcript_33610/m.45432 type:complete len:325 (-) Transcript_33610:11-985(-)
MGVAGGKPEMLIPTSRQVGIIDRLERAVSRDEGGRGIRCLVQHGDMLSAAIDISTARSVAIVTGFPCLIENDVPQETDGPLGAMAVARTVAALGHRALLLTDEINGPPMEACLSCIAADARGRGDDLCKRITLETFKGGAAWGQDQDRRLDAIAGEVDHVLFIERTGPAQDGTYRTASKKDMTHMVAPLERLAHLCAARGVRSTGIGDGGNEVGMGKVFSQVHLNIKNGPEIGCVTRTSHLIVASVSNWGGYALSAALAVLAGGEEGREKDRKGGSHKMMMTGLIVSDDQEEALCRALVEAGVADGLTGKLELSIDGMPLETSL